MMDALQGWLLHSASAATQSRTLLLLVALLPVLMLALALRRHTRALLAMAEQEHNRRGEQRIFANIEDCLKVVQQAVVETYGTAADELTFQCMASSMPAVPALSTGAEPWMSFLGSTDTLYVFSTRRRIWQGALPGRALKGPAAAELSGELNAVWRHLAQNSWRAGWVRRGQRWYVHVTTTREQQH